MSIYSEELESTCRLGSNTNPLSNGNWWKEVYKKCLTILYAYEIKRKQFILQIKFNEKL